MADQQGNVGPTLAQGRQLDTHDVEPVEEVLPEPSPGHHLLQVEVGGRNDAHVHPHRLPAAEGVELPVLEDPEQLGLQRQGQVADFVQEDGAAVGELEAAGLVAFGPSESPLDVAEKLGFEQVLGHRGAVDLDEGALGAPALGVDHLGQQVLAGAGGPLDDHGGIGAGNHPRQLEDPLHGRLPTDHVVQAVALADHLVELLDQGQVVKRGQPPHHLARLVAQRQVVGPYRHLDPVPSGHRRPDAAAQVLAGRRLVEQVGHVEGILAEKVGGGFPQHLPPAVAGEQLGRLVEKGDVSPAVDGEDPQVQVVEDQLEAALLVVDAVDEIGQRRLVVEHGEAAHHHPVRPVERRGDPHHQLPVAVGAGLHGDGLHVGTVLLDRMTTHQARHPEKHLGAVAADESDLVEPHHGAGRMVDGRDTPLHVHGESPDVEPVEQVEPLAAGNHGGADVWGVLGRHQFISELKFEVTKVN